MHKGLHMWVVSLAYRCNQLILRLNMQSSRDAVADRGLQL